MNGPTEDKASVWESEAVVRSWLDEMDARERRRADQFAFMARLLPFAEDEAFTFLDLGAGTGALSRTILTFYPRALAVLADVSPHMMGRAAEVMARFEGRYRYVPFDLRSAEWPDAIPVPVDAAMASQCFHHLPDARKRTLFGEIRERLIPGGWFFNFDPLRAADPAVEAVWKRAGARIDPSSSHQRKPRTPEEQALHEDHERGLATLDLQIGFLREAGFEAIDLYWKQLDNVIYGGRRPAAA